MQTDTRDVCCKMKGKRPERTRHVSPHHHARSALAPGELTRILPHVSGAKPPLARSRNSVADRDRQLARGASVSTLALSGSTYSRLSHRALRSSAVLDQSNR